MSLEKQIHDDMVAAMRAKDKTLTTTLRMAIAALKKEKVAGDVARELTEEEEVAVLQREVRARKDSAQAYIDGGRPELAEAETAEAEVLSKYLPAMLTDEELDQIIADEVQAAADASGEKPTMKQMGQIMKAVNAKVSGRAEGATVASKVKQALAG